MEVRRLFIRSDLLLRSQGATYTTEILGANLWIVIAPKPCKSQQEKPGSSTGNPAELLGVLPGKAQRLLWFT